MKWPTVNIRIGNVEQSAIAPLIISASRSTDIPAFFSDWFIERIRAGYSKWINPFNRKAQYVSYSRCKVVVFWSKNPKPMMRHLRELDSRKISYYFQYTLNDYEADGLEPNVPALSDRIDTFIELSDLIGKEKVIWRFDPIILTDKISIDAICDKINSVGERVHRYTNKLVFSFVDIERYKKVKNNLSRNNIAWHKIDELAMEVIASNISKMNKSWNLELATCGELVNLKKYNIKHNKCIDDCLICKVCKYDNEMTNFLSYNQLLLPSLKDNFKLKDPGQREECGCVVSKDVGQYNTCMHMCLYCYANVSSSVVESNYSKCSTKNDSII